MHDVRYSDCSINIYSSKRNPLNTTVLQSPLEFGQINQTRRLEARVEIENIEEQLQATDVGGKYERRRKRTVNTMAHRVQPSQSSEASLASICFFETSDSSRLPCWRAGAGQLVPTQQWITPVLHCP